MAEQDELLTLAVVAATAARDADRVAAALESLANWVYDVHASLPHDETYRRWLAVRHAFTDLDLTVFAEGTPAAALLARALATVDFLRHVDLSVVDRIELYARVLSLVPRDAHEARARLGLCLASQLAKRTGREAEAVGHANDALACLEQLSSPENDGDVLDLAMSRWRHCDVLLRTGHSGDAIKIMDKIQPLLVEREQHHMLGGLCMSRATAMLSLDKIVNAAVAAKESVDHYKAAGDSVGYASALWLRARCWIARGRHAEAAADLLEAVDRYAVAEFTVLQGRVMAFLGTVHAGQRRIPDALACYQRACAFLADSPETEALALTLVSHAGLLSQTNDEAATAARLDEAEEVATRLRPPEAIAVLLQICALAKRLPIPDKPRIRRAAQQARTLATEAHRPEDQDAALSYLGYAGVH
jgi:tetratricopeptide (TPR) repeat protein